MTDDKINGLALLRAKFPANLIGKLPKPTRSQTDEVKNNFKVGVRCVICGAWHHPKVVHLDYVGHAALTDRFLDADPLWLWEPMAVTDDGLPLLDSDGLLWIKLTICGVTRIGVGDAGDKKGGDAMKERIGDALRNAGMRFGAALDLWHKGDLHAGEEDALDNSAAKEGRDGDPMINNDKVTITADQVRKITAALKDAQYPVEGFLAKAGVDSLDKMTADRFDAAMTHIENVKESANAT